ncbi:hypothetical protein MMC28_006296 [Mycoblastus sanguinarius]|nr:hypothetical protein [Mycoblastus sanguinarius]
MHPNTFAAVFVAGLVRFAASQSIDPNSVDTATKPLALFSAFKSRELAARPSRTPAQHNGQQPNASQYSQTIPYYECTEAATQCVNNCVQGDDACQSNCRDAHPCGAQSPIRVNTSTSSTMSATSTSGSTASTADSTATGAYTGFGSGSTGSSSSSKSAASDRAQALALGFGRSYGLAMILAGVSGGFMFML